MRFSPKAQLREREKVDWLKPKTLSSLLRDIISQW